MAYFTLHDPAGAAAEDPQLSGVVLVVSALDARTALRAFVSRAWQRGENGGLTAARWAVRFTPRSAGILSAPLHPREARQRRAEMMVSGVPSWLRSPIHDSVELEELEVSSPEAWKEASEEIHRLMTEQLGSRDVPPFTADVPLSKHWKDDE